MKKPTEQELAMQTLCWMAGMLFERLFLYTPKCGSVEGIVMTNDKEYLDYCSKFNKNWKEEK